MQFIYLGNDVQSEDVKTRSVLRHKTEITLNTLLITHIFHLISQPLKVFQFAE